MENTTDLQFLTYLYDKIISRRDSPDDEKSYVRSLFQKGIDRIAQKVGEEAVETVIEAKNDHKEAFIYEASDLLFHLLVLLVAKGVSLADIIAELKKRDK
ncbi:MAG: phosphoribosyl-ATP diphosphatase [Candidatus Peribacteria bacterium]|jgi:phosphoribosyl-ATP pyrophosphohydrolase/phosphoribosyl-AMP cyclohydrolase|nr:phosphoribosyl-ATP diphosphatase [Candidatus Peribacteria bacterium]